MDISARGHGKPGLADEFLLGDPQLHARLLTAGELVACLMQAAPAALTTAALAKHIGQPRGWVQALLEGLHSAGLIHQDATHASAWYRHPHSANVTLAEIFLSVTGQATAPDASQDAPAGATRRQVDLLLGQATLSVNQLVLRQLRQFDLGRHLTAAASSRRYRKPLVAPET